MANSTQAYFANNVLYSGLVNYEVWDIPIFAALLNTSAAWTYADYLVEGVKVALDPLLRLHRKLRKGEDFFGKSEQNVWGKLRYFISSALVAGGAYLTVSSSMERAKAGQEEPQMLIDFCENILLPILIGLINWGLTRILFDTLHGALESVYQYCVPAHDTGNECMPLLADQPVLVWKDESDKMQIYTYDLTTDFGPEEYRQFVANATMPRLAP